MRELKATATAGNGIIAAFLGFGALCLFGWLVLILVAIAVPVTVIVLALAAGNAQTGVKRQAATILDEDANRRALRDVEARNPWLTDPSIPRPSQRRSGGQHGRSQAFYSDRR